MSTKLQLCQVVLPQGDSDTVYAINSHEALIGYMELVNSQISEIVREVYKHNKVPDSADELTKLVGDINQGSKIFESAIKKAQEKKANLLTVTNNEMMNRYKEFRDLINNYEVILVNMSGGYSLLSHEYTVLSSDDVDRSEKDYHVIRTGSEFLNLENDYCLERYTIEYLGNRDPNYSYVTNLRMYTEDELECIIDSFVKQGGDSLFVYTTGSDLIQMEQYLTICMNKKIKRVEMKFSEDHNTEQASMILNNFGDVFDIKIL